jgi:ABC-2 type transport system ATP-binding protein
VNALRVEGLRKTYGSVKALDGLDLAVEPGTVFGFLGPNGAGKTTTLKILAGLTRPTGGQAWVTEEPVSPESRAREVIGYLPEEPRFYTWMSAREFLARFVGGLFGMPRREGAARADELLERVGLQEAARRRIAGFSRGMRQRLGLAQALMNHPKVLLLDEPVSALDPGGRRDMLELIGQLKAEATVFMSTHILDDVERVCDTIGILNHGRLVALEGREALLSRYAVPVYEVEFEATPEAVAAWAQKVTVEPNVAGVEVSGSHVRVRLDGSGLARAGLQRLVLASGMTVVRYEIARPSLEDVFLRLVE